VVPGERMKESGVGERESGEEGVAGQGKDHVRKNKRIKSTRCVLGSGFRVQGSGSKVTICDSNHLMDSSAPDLSPSPDPLPPSPLSPDSSAAGSSCLLSDVKVDILASAYLSRIKGCHPPRPPPTCSHTQATSFPTASTLATCHTPAP